MEKPFVIFCLWMVTGDISGCGEDIFSSQHSKSSGACSDTMIVSGSVPKLYQILKYFRANNC